MATNKNTVNRPNLGKLVARQALLEHAKGAFECTDEWTLAQKLALLAYLDPDAGPIAEETLQALADEVSKPFLQHFVELQRQFEVFRDRAAGHLSKLQVEEEGL